MTNSTTATARTIAIRSAQQRKWHRAGNWSTTDRHVLADVLREVQRAYRQGNTKVTVVDLDAPQAPSGADGWEASLRDYPVVTDWDLPAEFHRSEIEVPEGPYFIDRRRDEHGAFDLGDEAYTTEEVQEILREASAEGRVGTVYRPDLWTYGTAFFVATRDGGEQRIRTRGFGPSETALSS